MLAVGYFFSFSRRGLILVSGSFTIDDLEVKYEKMVMAGPSKNEFLIWKVCGNITVFLHR